MKLLRVTPLLSLGLASPLLPRQDDNPSISTGCETADLTPANWLANGIDATIAGSTGFGQAANWPKLFLQNDNPKLEFECADLNNPEKCTIPKNFVFLENTSQFEGTVCGAFRNPQLGFIGQAWVNLYTHLRNINNAVQPAVNNILNTAFIDDLVAQSTSEPLPIPKDVLFKLVEVSLLFIPNPVGAGLGAFRTVASAFTKLANKALKISTDEAADQEQNISDQPKVLRYLLGRVPAWMQESLKQQNDDIFVNSHTDNTLAGMLKDGKAISTPDTQYDYQKAIERNLKVFALAHLWTKISMTLLVSNPTTEGRCLAGARMGDKCMEFKYPDGVVGVTLATGENPRNAGAAITSTGLTFETVVTNALDCFTQGKTFSDADFDGFLTLDASDDQAIPTCLLGFPVTVVQN
ncbi:hypothetical protein NM208_g398 [Fusarium decemcellulare]|uniref:Uncharacterized protein n=2 Tax=Fusarium decemcellulare TaxID=57161 RepID=A0ACC1SZV0_9HYPO|nr:hypothetical protein NM208_g3909 [Fusarium decemcellulare]KAJ3549662.1 hypothetical protein NM208_g398 [Fusarium decemcellulare]